MISDVYKATDYEQQQKIMTKPKAINRKKLVAFVLPIIRKEKLPMSEELEKLRQKQYVAERKLQVHLRL